MSPLTIGSKGDGVRKVQAHLKELGFNPGPVDGIFGKGTGVAVREFQSAYLCDGIVDTVTLQALKDAVAAWKLERAPVPGAPPVPKGEDQVKQTFGTFAYEEAGGGNVVIIGDWAAKNIVTVDLEVVGRQQVHRLLADTFASVFRTLKGRGLDADIKQFGCWCPRHKMHNPKRRLSTHSWAIACDINWATNMPGRVGDLDPAIVETFEVHGFKWGGRWRYRDDMHFQYCVGY